jgi:hypothetical protein
MKKSIALSALFGALAAATPARAADACPYDARALTAGAPYTCTCAPNSSTGSVYGTDRYTTDSPICTAAVHAGVIQAGPGGDVTVHLGDGCPAYKSTTQNGITSNRWGAYPQTYGFVDPLPDCALQADAGAPAAPAPAATPSTPPPPPAAAGPATNAGPEQWQARGERFATALPEPLPGWEATKAEGFWENSDMTQKIVAGHRTYKKGGGMQSDVMVEIFNNPDGAPHERTENMWTDEAFRTARGGKMGEAAGRPALIVEQDGDIRVVFRMDSGLFVSVSILGSHDTTREDIDAYIAKLDFEKISKLPME